MNGSNNVVLDKWAEVFLGISVIVSFIIPHTSTLLLLVNPLLCLFLFIKKKSKSILLFSFIPVMAIIVSLLLNVSGEAGFKAVLSSATIILYILTFPFVENTNLRNIYIYICFGLIFISQICYMFQIGWAIQMLETFYPISWGERMITYANEHVTISNYSNFRLGGLYHNPNQCAKYISLLLAIYLVNNKNKRFSKQVLFVVLCFIGVLLTGSRTGFIVAALLVVLCFWTNGRMSKALKIITVLGMVAFIVYAIASGSSNSRSLDIEDGLEGSLFAKAKLVLYYLNTETSALSMVFGHLDLDLFLSPFSYSLDCEYGYILYCYGLVGLISFVIYVVKLFKGIEKENRFFMVFLLWMLTSSIFMSYRTVFVFMLILSSIYNRQNRELESL